MSDSAFPSTLWSVVVAAGAGAGPALETLAARYSGPVYAYFRGSGLKREDAEDLAQEFFAHLLESNALAKADPTRGRFRAFLLGSARNFLRNDADRRRAEKRGGGRRRLSLDVERAEEALGLGSDGEDPSRRFDRHWAEALIGRALAALSSELSGPAARAFALAQEAEPKSYREIGVEVGLSEGAVATAVHRARKRLRGLILEEATATVSSPREAEEELRDLLKALGRSP